MIFNRDQVDSDSLISDDERTMSILCSIANTISEIQFTFDSPSRNQSGFVPILDVQMKIVNNRVVYLFYKKPCASPFTLLKRSAIPESTKRTTNFQEGIRRLFRTSMDTDWSTKADILAVYSNMLKISGYSHQYRLNTISGVLKRWDQMVSDINSGKIKFHRSRSMIDAQRAARGGQTAANWFLKDLITTTLSLPMTENSSLKRAIQSTLSSIKGPDGGQTMMLEQAGKKADTNCPQAKAFY